MRLPSLVESQPSPLDTRDGPLEVLRTKVVDDAGGGVQVVVEVRNTGDDWVFLNDPQLGASLRGTLQSSSGVIVSDEDGLRFSGFPRRLAPGQIGYYLAAGEPSAASAEDVMLVDFAPQSVAANGPPAWQATVTPRGFEGVGDGSILVHAIAQWDGDDVAIAAVIAFDDAGEILGFARSSHLARPGAFTLCCLPNAGPYAEGVADTTFIVVREEHISD